MKESKLIQMQHDIKLLQNVMMVVLTRLEKLEEEKK